MVLKGSSSEFGSSDPPLVVFEAGSFLLAGSGLSHPDRTGGNAASTLHPGSPRSRSEPVGEDQQGGGARGVGRQCGVLPGATRDATARRAVWNGWVEDEWAGDEWGMSGAEEGAWRTEGESLS